MVKSLVSMLVAIALLVGGAIYERDFITRQFNELQEIGKVLYIKVDSEEATEEDVLSVQKNWLMKKQVLHIFIPHNEIKEVDLWITEAVKLVHNQEWTTAISKVEVICEFFEQLPKNFSVSLENIL